MLAPRALNTTKNPVNFCSTYLSPVPNEPSDCSEAAPSIDTIWPPNHKFVPVNILGVTDPDGVDY